MFVFHCKSHSTVRKCFMSTKKNALDLLIAQLRDEKQSVLDKKQLLDEALREQQHLLNMKRGRLGL